jgi:hypothetical protein
LLLQTADVAAANARAQEDAEAFMKRVGGMDTNTSAYCRGRLHVVEQRAAHASVLRALLGPLVRYSTVRYATV